MKRRRIYSIAVLTLLFCLWGCKGEAALSSTSLPSPSPSLVSKATPTPKPSPTSTPTPTPSPTPEPKLTGKCGDNLTWTLDLAGTLTISGTGEMFDYEPHWDGLVFHQDGTAYTHEELLQTEGPWKHDVWVENGNGDEGEWKILNIVVEDGVTGIGEAAFFGIHGLQSVALPASLRRIGPQAFACARLSQITIPADVTEIGDMAFLQTGVYFGDSFDTVRIQFEGTWTQWKSAAGEEPGQNVFVSVDDRPKRLTESEAYQYALRFWGLDPSLYTKEQLEIYYDKAETEEINGTLYYVFTRARIGTDKTVWPTQNRDVLVVYVDSTNGNGYSYSLLS